ncbi:uncharacterized protein BT62DRAFT_937347 [Guyanagaster necrorhizus]|uniref:RING-type domain-containing protein n=1 Tax=Guyanagaster necrorhizus TaxID=856835 RepID=A0A9P7VI92_9AGAR|nr:uncharacterized protein BT62DRAFT_937347 [Guyanagaster necrorhizus MCA 3950]KAG7441107.1 hypothetical protein BT62DRAFT_937347 [Guyanagaster necrorhizus MCA 3950]
MADGLPLLSGPPPSPRRPESSCRKCNKEFNIIFTRSRQCNHCGYSYCHSCTDYQALMPRTGSNGYEALNVCAYCIEFLQMTAASKGTLRNHSLAKLRKYANAYDIRLDHAVEKDDVIETLITARCPNGCLSATHERYYRQYSVPDRYGRPRGLFSRTGSGSGPTQPLPLPRRPTNRQPTYEFPRPDLVPDDPSPLNRPRAPTTPPRQTPTTPPRQASVTPPRPNPSSPPRQSPPQVPRQTPLRPQYQQPRASRSSENLNAPRTSPRARTASTSPPPTLNQLVEMTPASISALSIGSLKAILFSNHVNVGMILEKSDLVSKVTALVEDEKRDRERQRLAEEQEEQERIQRQREMMEEFERTRQAETEQKSEVDGIPASPSPHVTPPKAPLTFVERSGLCVVCQDEEANIAIVDCGHLAMCRECSELIMAGTRECPLCRTRIVTEARLLRIFKT